MPILIYNNGEGQYQEQELSDQKDIIRIGSDPTLNDIVLPLSLGVAHRHAVVLRSAANKLPVLVNLAGESTYVNGRRVVTIQVLRQKDTLQLGQAQLMMWEVRITAARPGNRSVGQNCPVCLMRIQVGDEVIICPRCSTPSHRMCWFSLNRCARDACVYPIRDRVIEALSQWVTFELALDANSELIRNHKKCQARTRVDQVTFQEGDYVTYCPSPSCRASFHLQCWLGLEHCTMPGCGYGIQQLIDKVFLTGDLGAVQTGAINGK